MVKLCDGLNDLKPMILESCEALQGCEQGPAALYL